MKGVPLRTSGLKAKSQWKIKIKRKNRLVRYESIKRQNPTRLMRLVSFTFNVTHWRKYVGSSMRYVVTRLHAILRLGETTINVGRI